MRVVDANRVIGPLPAQPGECTPAAMLRRMEKLGIEHAVVTPSWHLYGDPRASTHYDGLLEGLDPKRFTLVPCVIPASVQSAGTDPRSDTPMVRACPERHRFDLLSRPALAAWEALVERGATLVLDASEVGFSAVDTVCGALPELQLFMIRPGYREVRRISELLQAHEHLHVEVGSLNSAGSVEWLAQNHGSDRLVFGTGAPVMDDGGPRFALDHLLLEDSEIDEIAHGTFDRLVGASA